MKKGRQIMVYCPNCGNPNDDASKFCIKCGESLDVRPEAMGPTAKPRGGGGGAGRMIIVALLALIVVGVIGIGVYLVAQGIGSGEDWIAYQTQDSDGDYNLWLVRPDGEEPIEVMSGVEWDISYTSVQQGEQQSEYTPFAPKGNRMLFTVYDGEERSLYTYVLGEDDPERIVRRARDLEYRFSPDGQRIAVEIRDEDNERSLLVMDVDGENQVSLFSGAENNVAWDWLPNSRQLIVMRYDRGYALYVTDVDGKDEVTLAEDLDWVEYIVSSDGDTIAYAAEEDDEWDLYVVDADGSDANLLEKGFDDLELLDLTPDGKQLLVKANSGGSSYDLYLMETDGADRVTLARDVEDAEGGFCPDGKRIWFIPWEDGEGNLYLAGADGEDEIRIERGIEDWEMEFTPDGRTMIVGLVMGGDWDLYAVEVATGEQVELIGSVDQLGPPVIMDNTQVLFSAGDGDERILYIARLDGEETLELAGPVDGTSGYDISPDGRRIVYGKVTSRGYLEYEYRLHVIDVDGENEEELVDDGFWPHWSD